VTTDRTPLLYVMVDDQRAPVDLTRAVLDFSVDEHAKKATKIALTLDDPDQRFRAMLPEGATIAVRWGWPGSLSQPRGGIIHKAAYSSGDFTLAIEAYGKELALSKGVVRRTFRAKTLKQAIENVARGSGLTLDWQAPDTITFDGSVIDNETVWSWIQRRPASRQRCWLCRLPAR
jgi:phage protein D